MYAQCDVDYNEYLLLDLLINYQADGNAISLADHEISVKGRPITRK